MNGDEFAELVFNAMAYQTAKHIAGLTTVNHGDVDMIVLTGGLANSDLFVEKIQERVSFLAPVIVYPGENEMESLAMGAYRILKNEEQAKLFE